jgi:outer membrane receptor protein involved in Fe transport
MASLRYSAAVRAILLSLLILFPSVATAQRGPQLTGSVVDASGAPVAGATVAVGSSTTKTASDGSFSLAVPAGQVSVQASADGFATTTTSVSASAESARVVLQPAPIEDKVLVTASRGSDLATAGSMTVVTSAELLNSGAGALDDALRSTPGFSLFRRTTSRVSNPTTQGVTLRGVSGSGSSRTLVLADGVPLNDPFGSWVYWNRVPEAAIDRVELVRGATGDIYGAEALGGVVQVLTFAPGHTRVRFTSEGGSLGTGRVSGFASKQQNGWYGEGAGEWYHTDGYVQTAPEVAGAVDIAANDESKTGFVGGGYNHGDWHAGLRVNLYQEERNNGTPLTVNTTSWTQVTGEGGGALGGGAWTAHGSGGGQSYYQTFSAVVNVTNGAQRTGERLTNQQTTPSEFYTASGQWTRAFGPVSVLGGVEGHRTDATIQEYKFACPTSQQTSTGCNGYLQTGPFFTGGNERNTGAYARVSFAPVKDVTVVAGARGDWWSSDPNDTTLPTHDASFFSPRVSAGWRISDMFSLHGAGYRSSRTPTLNELYRGFRVGAIDTQANPALNPETLTGGEAGVLFTVQRVTARVTGFFNQLDDAITNVTIGTNLRQRQNTQTLRAHGVEAEANYHLASRWTFNGVAVGTWANFEHTPEQPAIEGNRVPQVPSFQVGGSVIYTDPIGFTGAVQMRAFGETFDDDLNQFPLARYGVVDLSASQRLVREVNVFVAVENLFDKDYDTGKTPLRTVGLPRTARVGIRVFLP